jgi:trk system potassium uptake protein TrkA
MLISGSTQIQAGDVVMAFCHDVDIKRLEKFFN